LLKNVKYPSQNKSNFGFAHFAEALDKNEIFILRSQVVFFYRKPNKFWQNLSNPMANAFAGLQPSLYIN
jgi:hypothetical protein